MPPVGWKVHAVSRFKMEIVGFDVSKLRILSIVRVVYKDGGVILWNIFPVWYVENPNIRISGLEWRCNSKVLVSFDNAHKVFIPISVGQRNSTEAMPKCFLRAH